MDPKRLTPILYVEQIEPCLPFWIQGLGLKVTTEVSEGERLGFVILQKGELELMMQTRESVRNDFPALEEEVMRGPAVLYIEVQNLEGLEERLTARGAEVVHPRRQTFLGAGEVYVRGPCGTLVGLAAMAAEDAESTRPPEEAKLDFLLGEWTSSDQTHPGPQGPGGSSEGTASYRWEVGGAWLVYDFQTEIPGMGSYAVRGGVAYVPAELKYVSYAVNSGGALLLYDGAWESENTLVFTLVYPRRDADTRVSYTRRNDGTVRMTSERPAKEGGRELYFETLLSR